VERDFGVEAAVVNVLENTRLIMDACKAAEIVSPLLEMSRALYAETVALGLGDRDMTAVLRTIERRSGEARRRVG